MVARFPGDQATDWIREGDTTDKEWRNTAAENLQPLRLAQSQGLQSFFEGWDIIHTLTELNGAKGQAYGFCLISRGIISHILDVEPTSQAHIGE